MAYRRKEYCHWGYAGIDSPAQNGHPSYKLNEMYKEEANTRVAFKDTNNRIPFAELHNKVQCLELEGFNEATRLALRETLHCIINFRYWMRKTPGVLVHMSNSTAAVAAVKDKLDWRTGKNKSYNRDKWMQCIEVLEELGYIENPHNTIEANPVDYPKVKNPHEYDVYMMDVNFKKVVQDGSAEGGLF